MRRWLDSVGGETSSQEPLAITPPEAG